MDMPLQFNMEKMGRSMSLGGNGNGMDDMGHQGHDVSTSSDIIGGGDRMMQPQMMGMMGGAMGGNHMGGNPMGGSVGMGPMGGGAMGSMGGMGFSGPMNMMGPDPNMMMMGPMGYNQFTGYNMGQMGPGMDCPPEFMRKDVIELKFGTLFPPPPGAPLRSRREKPHGCRTVFVGSLPDGVTEENVCEIFERFGNIESVRLNKSNYCHIRYQFPDSVELALVLSGYTLKIEGEEDDVRSKHIHVDYAQARDDLYEFECLQRALARENRHRQQVEEDRLRPPSPPPVVRFSEYEAQILLEKLKSDDTFDFASSTLRVWLTKGDCNRRTSNVFYSLIQSTNSHVRRLLTEKETHEKELENVKATFRQQIQGILNQFEHIENVFIEAQKQRTSDHFSKAQRKNIDTWCKQIQEIKRIEQEKFISDRHEDEMEMSDTDMDDEDGPSPFKRKKGDFASQHEVYQLREENDSLRCQLEAYKNEVDILKQDSKKEVKVLQQALQGMQQQLISFRVQAQKEKAKEAAKNASKTIEENKENKPEAAAETTSENKTEVSTEITVEESLDDKDMKDSESTEPPVEKDKETEADATSEDKSPNVSSKDADLSSRDQPVKEIIVLDDPIINDPVVSAAMRFASEKRKQLEKEQKEMLPSVFPTSFHTSFNIPSSSTTVALSEKEAKIICLVSCFLHVHPFGASTDYLWSYLQRLNLFCRPSEIEDLMERLPMVYKIELFGVGASLERRWKFIGFDGCI